MRVPLRQRLSAWFFDGVLPQRPAAWRWTSVVARLLGLSALRFHRDRGTERAASLAYATLLALIPFLVLAASLIEFLQPSQQTDVADWFVRAVFPPEASEVRAGVLDYIARSRSAFRTPDASGTGLRIIGAAMLFWFASNLITGVDRVVGDVWGTGSIRAFVRRLAAYWAVLTIGPILLALSIAGTALLRARAGESLGGFVTSLLPFVVTWISAFAFFRLMPHTGATNRAALAGAVVAGTLWEGTKLAMGWYLAMPKTLLTALSFFPAAVLWMYVSWAIAIYGLEVTYVVHHGNWRPGRRVTTSRPGSRERDEISLAVAVETARAFDEGREPDRAELAWRLGTSEDRVRQAADALRDAGILATGETGALRPARGAAGIRAVDVVAAARGKGGAACVAPAVRRFLDRLDLEGGTAAGKVTLHDLVREDQPAEPAPGVRPK